jgi:hypothetical protein
MVKPFDPEDYELHQVEREELHEEWVWVKDKDLKKCIEGQRPALLLKCRGKSVCCETLYADDTYLRNRHQSILVGKITVVHPNHRFTIKWGKHHKFAASFVVKEKKNFAWDIDKQPLFINQIVQVLCPGGEEDIKAAKSEIVADGVSLENNRLVFMNSWYRRRLGIGDEVGSRIPLIVKTTNWRVRAVWWQVRACARHPQIAVVMSTVLAFIGTGLGIAGLAIGSKDTPWLKGVPGVESVCQAFVVVGVAVFLVGFVPLFLRAKS